MNSLRFNLDDCLDGDPNVRRMYFADGEDTTGHDIARVSQELRDDFDTDIDSMVWNESFVLVIECAAKDAKAVSRKLSAEGFQLLMKTRRRLEVSLDMFDDPSRALRVSFRD